MVNTLKTLGQVEPTAATLTTLYTVPGATSCSVSSITVCNQSATDTSFRVAVRPAGASISNEHYIYYDVAIPGNDTFIATIGVSLEETDVVTVYATLGTLSFGLWGQEHS